MIRNISNTTEPNLKSQTETYQLNDGRIQTGSTRSFGRCHITLTDKYRSSEISLLRKRAQPDLERVVYRECATPAAVRQSDWGE